MKPPLFLIDAYGLIYRFYFAFNNTPPLRNEAGENVSVLVEFAQTIVSLLDKGVPLGKLERQKPQRLGVIFDSQGPTFRHKRYPAYKAKRPKTPEDLHAQVPLVEGFLRALKVPALRAEGYEADDGIATLARRCTAEGRVCYIITADKDLLQLVGDGVYVLEPEKQRFGYALIGAPEVKDKWGAGPEKIGDLLALAGDSADNIPGVPGIGEKTALKLITRYGSLDGIYDNIAGIEGAIGKKLAAGKESAYFSKSLIALEEYAPLEFNGKTDFTLDDLSVETLDRTAGAEALLREGIRKVAAALDPGALDLGTGSAESALRVTEPGRYETLTDLPALAALLESARNQGFMALDFETDSLDAWHTGVVGFSCALRPGAAVYVPVAPHQGTARFLDPQQVRSLLEPVFADPAMTVIAHNAKFDYGVSRGWGIPRWQCRMWDTMVGAWVADPERNSYALDSLIRLYFNYTPKGYTDIVPKGATFAEVSLETATQYAGEDADFCLRMKLLLEPKLAKTESLDLFCNLEMPLVPILAEMEAAGIRIEKESLQDYGRDIAKQLDQLQFETYQLVGHTFNLASTKQLQEVLFTERNLTPTKKTKTGFSTDVDVLEALAQVDPVPQRILRHRTLSKLKSTYIDGLAELADAEGRVHTSFIQTGTATGRLSSREPNLQNIPVRDEEGRRIREAFRAKPGWLLISADYSQIELAVLAHLSEDPELIGAFQEGKDIHAQTAARIFGVPAEEVRPEQRRIAKVINFGVMYGMSAFRLAGELGISRTDAAAFIDAYFTTYAGVSGFIKNLITKTESLGYVSTIFGRRRYIPGINARNKTEKSGAERIAVNTPIQGSAADIVKTAMCNLDKALTAENSPARLLLQVHDELILEVPEPDAPAAAVIVRREMENAVSLKVPLRVSVEIGARWGDFH